ncbi:MAG: hypothetical protein P8Y63_11925 [Deltaproteobacteria bacterium]|jgi:hypothetical protein
MISNTVKTSFSFCSVFCIATMIFCASIATAQEIPKEPVGQKPPPEKKTQEVVTLLEQRGALINKGGFVIEPSFDYIHSSATRVAIEGFTIIPAVAIGLIDVSELQRDTLIGAMAFRYGLTNWLEIGTRIPYVYRSENVRERAVNTGSSIDVIQGSEGNHLGDIEFGIHYQFNLTGSPVFIGNIRAKSRTGTDPFEVDRKLLLSEDGTPIGEIFTEQPTGSGFWGIQPSITMIYPSDPLVLYANVSYLWNIKRNVGGTFGEVDPGDIVGVSFGFAFSSTTGLLSASAMITTSFSNRKSKTTRGWSPSFPRSR